MNKISQVTEDSARTIEDLPGDKNRELGMESGAQNLTRESSNSLSVGVPRRVFDALYHSFSELNSKLASRVEINDTPGSHDSEDTFDSEDTLRPSPLASASAQFLGHHDFCEDAHGFREPFEGQSVGTVDRCCVCSTPATEEELMTTPCCFRAVGSICFDERLEDTTKCCLCQAPETRSDQRCSAAPSEVTSDYKFNFATETLQDDGDHLVTKSHVLKLIDQDVIYYLEDVHPEDLLDFIHSALKNQVHHIACKRFFYEARVQKNGNVSLSICSKCSQDADLMNGMKDWPRAFQSFVLTTQMRSYKVTVENIQIGSMKISRGFEKSKTIQTLVNDNTSVLKSLKTPAEIRGICWNKRVAGLKPIERTSITITFSTAQQANEAIEHGILWNHERRRCRRQGPHPRITQCRNCLAYGHILKDCSSAPRCHVCAGMHLSKECTWDPVADKACRKCALCGGAHDAMNEECNSRKAERQRLQLGNRFYPTGAEKVELDGTA